MAGVLAWAADFVGATGTQTNDQIDSISIPIIFTPDQQNYVRELDRKSASLSRSIQDLRLRLPPTDISQRLPHLHAHSLASNADLALQLNSHTATREQAQLREVTLQEENDAYKKAISDCDSKIQEKMLEANLLRIRLKEMNETEKNLVAELENAQTARDDNQSGKFGEPVVENRTTVEDGPDTEDSKSAILDMLEIKKKESSSLEEIVQDLEKKWAHVQDRALKQPSPAQREKILDKQLHSLIEQLAGKQAQAEDLVSEIHLTENELKRLNGMWRHLESSNSEMNTARNRFGRSISEKGSSSSDQIVDAHHKLPYYFGGRTENQQRLMFLRSAFVLYILALHILVFIKISF